MDEVTVSVPESSSGSTMEYVLAGQFLNSLHFEQMGLRPAAESRVVPLYSSRLVVDVEADRFDQELEALVEAFLDELPYPNSSIDALADIAITRMSARAGEDLEEWADSLVAGVIDAVD